jgi:hypothetical protein
MAAGHVPQPPLELLAAVELLLAAVELLLVAVELLLDVVVELLELPPPPP